MACSARRPKRPESRDGCVSRMRSLQLQKSPTADFEQKCGNSSDISKGIPQLGMCKFESSQVSQAVRVSENFVFWMRKARQTRAFLIASTLWRPTFELFGPKNPKSLQPNPRKLPISGD